MRVLSVLLLLALAGCNCGAPPAAAPDRVDSDGDGADSTVDCNDGDPAIKPGLPEVCGDGKDNNCDGVVDEGCAPSGCKAEDAPKACGVAGGGCVQRCSNGVLGACEAASGPIDPLTDAKNCGECGKACPTPVNAAAACQKGVCGRGPCQPGTFDLDGKITFGCELKCTGKSCTDPAGKVVTLDNALLPETGLVFQALSSGAAFGSAIQTSPRNTNLGSLGEPTPPGAAGSTSSKNDKYRHVGGFNAALR